LEFSLEAMQFAVNVLQTPLGVSHLWEKDDPVYAARMGIIEDYQHLKSANPSWSFTECSERARADWLRSYLNRLIKTGLAR
jgi:hypothetical protein